MRSEFGKALVTKKRALEESLFKLVSNFEKETGLSVTEIVLTRPSVAGEAEPTLEHIYTTVELIAG